MQNIVKFFECLIPETVCNLKCDYCYIIQRNHNTNIIPNLDYPIDVMEKSLTKERLGGPCYFSICGAGETFVPDYLIDIIYILLKNGHYVNVTTNGTLTNKIKKLSNIPNEWIDRLHISFSFHYLELKRLNIIDTFWKNVHFVKKLGCSFIVQLNLYDEYIPYLKEIKEMCLNNIGALPQIAATRKEIGLTKKIELMTELSRNEYVSYANEFNSKLFDFTMENFNKKQNGYCYAGSWTYTLNLKTGILKRCYCSCIHQNIFENTDKPIMDLAVGNHCGSLFCMNSSHFLSLGSIPEMKTPSYVELRDREDAHWFNENVKTFLSQKLKDGNVQHSSLKKLKCNIISFFDKKAYALYVRIRKH